MTEGVLLRFVWVHGVHTNTRRDYDAEWLQGSVALLLDDDSWRDKSREHLEEIKEYTT